MSEKTWKCTVQELVKATGGQELSSVHADFAGVGTDTRLAIDGQLFIPLKGESFNGHDFVAKAVELNARVILVHEWREEWKPLLAKATFVKVQDTLQGLQSLARYLRKKHAFKVIAITGSNGKTSTKEYTYALLKSAFAVHASQGSFNNHWGVPLSILAAGPAQKVLVLEMGMNHAGELFRLCQIAEPDVVAVTNVGRAHIGELGSQAKVADAKEEVYIASPKAVHVFNMDNEWTIRMQARSSAKQVLFSSFRANEVDVHLRAQRLTWDGLDIVGHIQKIQGRTWVNVLGRQNTANLMCAAALALAVGLSPEEIWKQMAAIHDVSWGRNQILPMSNGARVLFDAYNANPDSMTALLKNLYEMEMAGRKFLVVGDMKELGTFTEASHEEVGERAGSVGFEGIWYIGQNAKPFLRGLEKSGKPKMFMTSYGVEPALAKEFARNFANGDLIAVKGSRGMYLEKAVETWPLTSPFPKKL